MGTANSDSFPRLELYKCTRCRRAFFSAERQEAHILNTHGKKWSSISGLLNLRSLHHCNKVGIARHGNWCHRHRSKSFREAAFNTLISNWPPEKAHNKICHKHRISHCKAQQLSKVMLSSKYSPLLHSSQNVLKVLLEEYSKDSTTTQQRTEDICQATGLSPKYIELWFLWRRSRGCLSPGNELLNDAFFKQPYPSDEVLQRLMSDTGILLSLIQLRFRVMRAKFQVFEFKEAQEKVLWAYFMKDPGSLANIKEAKDVAGVVGMKTEDVQVIFEYWRIHWFTADNDSRTNILAKSREICSLLGVDINSNENILTALEKARSSQKIFGIPTRCQVLKRSKSGAVTKLGYVNFGSYVSERSTAGGACPSKAKVDDTEEVETKDPATSSSELFLEPDPMTYGSLQVQSDVLDHSKSMSLPGPDPEPNLYSLFNTLPKSPTRTRQMQRQRCPSENSDEDASMLEDEILHVGSSEDEESNCSESSDEEAMEVMMPQPLNGAREVIDLTLGDLIDAEDTRKAHAERQSEDDSETNCCETCDDADAAAIVVASETPEIRSSVSPVNLLQVSSDEADTFLVICESDGEDINTVEEKPDKVLSTSSPSLFSDDSMDYCDSQLHVESRGSNSGPSICNEVTQSTIRAPNKQYCHMAPGNVFPERRPHGNSQSTRRTMFTAPLPLGKPRRILKRKHTRILKGAPTRPPRLKSPLFVKSIAEGKMSAYFDIKQKLH